MSTIVENLSAEEKREALDLVFQSQTFSRSDRLKSLLRFICEAEIEGRSGDLKEYSIAIEALGKPPEFSPGEDSSVRSRAYELRRKLEKFYATEAPYATVRIEIPKGSYLPHFIRFVPHEIPAPQETFVLPVTPPPATDTHRRTFLPLLGAFIAGIAIGVCGMLVRNAAVPAGHAHVQPWGPDLEAIWKPMLDSEAPILVSFQSRLFLHVGPLNVRDWKVNSIDAVERSEAIMRVKQLFNVPQVYENRDYVDSGEANAVFQLSRLLATRKQNIFAKRSTDVTWDDLKENNLIILGKPEADPTVSRWLAKGQFMVVGGVIRNLHPRHGELSEWHDDGGPTQGWKQKYALVTMIPGPGKANWVMSMSGSGSEHLWAMADYFTDPGNARDLVRHLRLPSGKLPSAYQVVIRADFKSQTPVKVVYVAHRALENL
jgi:hypothetical protein